MKLVIKRRFHKLLLILGYFVLPAVFWLLFGAYGAAFGFFFAYLLDRFYPRTMTFLNWDQVELGVSNFLETSVLGARFTITFGQRKIFFFRGEMWDKPILVLRFCRKQWAGVIDEDTEAFFLKKRVSAIMPEELWRFRMFVTMDLPPERESVPKAVAIIRDVCELSGIDVNDLHSRGDYCHLRTRALFETKKP